MNTPTSFQWAAVALATLALMGCGGGSNDPAAPTPEPTPPVTFPVTPPVTTNPIPQGIWQGAPGASIAISTVVTENGQLWSVLTGAQGTRLLKASLSASGAGFSGTGKAFLLGSTTPATTTDAVSLSASAVSKTSLSGSMTSTATGTPAEPFSLAYQSRYDTPVTLASFAGNTWTATLGPGTLNWSIDSSGKITGTRTTGCTYSGNISLRTEAKAVANVAITESCPAVTQLSGVAIKTPDNTGITLLLTTTGDAQGVVIGLK